MRKRRKSTEETINYCLYAVQGAKHWLTLTAFQCYQSATKQHEDPQRKI